MTLFKKYFNEAYTEKGLISAKLNHYFTVYEEQLSQYKDSEIKLLEIGVRNGGSLYMWQKYFSNASLILGVDIEETCKKHEEKLASNVCIEIGDQSDKDFLEKIGRKYGPFDIIIDDGGHQFNQQKNSLNTLFHFLNEDGVYIVEDTHSSYDNYANLYPKDNVYGGGLKQSHTGVEYFKSLCDKVTNWAYIKSHGTCPLYSPKNSDIELFMKNNSDEYDIFDTHLTSVSFYDSIVIFHKNKKSLPFVVFNNKTGKGYNVNFKV